MNAQLHIKRSTPALSLELYTGIYENEIYEPVPIDKDEQGKGLVINFKGHNNLKGIMQYVDYNEWLLTYNNLCYGIFPTTFKVIDKKVSSVELRVNEFIDYDSYNFIKKYRRLLVIFLRREFF